MRLLIPTLLFATLCGPAIAEVVKSDANGFIIQQTVNVSEDVATVFSAMTTDVGKWWNASHTFSGDSGNLHIDQHCFCERWERNLVRHLNTAMWLQDSSITMEGGLGPLKGLGLDGTMIWSLTPVEEGGTSIGWKYYVNGFTDTDVVEFAPVVDGVLAEQIMRLAKYLQ